MFLSLLYRKSNLSCNDKILDRSLILFSALDALSIFPLKQFTCRTDAVNRINEQIIWTTMV